MRILITADLHYDIARSKEPARDLASRVMAAAHEGDVLVLLGDTAGADTRILREALELFADFPGHKLMVMGNHCLWRRGEETSMDRYERIIPAAAEEAGFTPLDHRPVVLGRVGIVGSVGWYDYSFREESLGIPEAFYRSKVAPGAAAYLEEHHALAEAHRDVLTEEQLALGVRWMDGVHVNLGVSDEEFTRMLAGKLKRQMDEIAPRVDEIVAFLHHLPFRELVPKGRPPRFAFAAAYMGSEQFGKVLLEQPKVSRVYCGHSHWPHRQRIGRLDVVNVGSTYTHKQLEVIEIP
jgi:predicted phosphohydrolase